jgi:hypothetical protein
VIAISVLVSAVPRIVFDVLTERTSVGVVERVVQLGVAEPDEVKTCPTKPLDVGAITVPLVAGKVRTVAPATAGACRATEPDVSPEITNELMFFP